MTNSAQGKGGFGPQDLMDVAIGVTDGKVFLEFPGPVKLIAMPPEDALSLAEGIMRHARAAMSSGPVQ